MSIHLDINVDVDDIVSSVWSRYDQKQLLEALLDVMDVRDVLEVMKEHHEYEDRGHQVRAVITGDNESFIAACRKIYENRWRLNLQDEEYIVRLADKL